MMQEGGGVSLTLKNASCHVTSLPVHHTFFVVDVIEVFI